MAFDGTEGKQITIAEASEMTENYRTAHPGATLAHYVGKDLINAILGQPGCTGLRIYYGIDNSGNKELVIVGADSNENDMVSGIIADRFIPCPMKCGTSNPLNS